MMTAACRSQSWLQENGYLERLDASENSRIYFDINDKMSGLPSDKDGSLKLQAILDARAGTFIDKLWGVRIKELEYRSKDGQILKETIADVAYRFDDGAKYFLRCVSSEVTGDWVQLIHQDCIDKDFIRLSESELVCRNSTPAIVE